MNKLDLNSKDITKDNIQKIAELFPDCVTENEKQELKVDFDKLQEALGNIALDENAREKYEMTWPGKKAAKQEAVRRISKTLRPNKDASVNFDNTENIYIEGDNLDALKILQESYLGKIKCIYIDPPYNTGHDFIYPDNFAKTAEEEAEDAGEIDDYGNRLVANTESNSRFHSDWLSMMYPRLKLARNLLASDGIIFISIDDNEQDNLKKICDEIFGANNFVAQFIVDKTAQGANQSLTFKTQHEFCLMYKKDSSDLIDYELKSEVDTKKYKYSDTKGAYAITNAFDSINSPLTSNKNRGYTVYYNPQTGDAIAKDEYNKDDNTFGDYDDSLIKKGYEPIRPGIRNSIQYPWNWMRSRFEEQYKDELVFQKNRGGNWQIYHKNRFNGLVKDTTIKKFDTRQDGNKSLIELMGGKVFDYPKSVEMLKWVLAKVKGNDFVTLDFFSGSASMAHAVMQKNAEDGGARKFILVQIPEECQPKSEAAQMGYQNICQVGEERIRRAAKKIKEETKADIDYGFRVYRVDSSNIKDVNKTPSDLLGNMESNALLEAIDSMESNIKEDRTPEDLLIQVILNLGGGVDLSSKIEEKEINGKKVFFVDGTTLIACFDDSVDMSVIEEIAKQSPIKAVFRDSSFGSDSDRINVEETFKAYSAKSGINTEVVVL